MSNNIETLRAHLFATLADLTDKTKEPQLERARAIAEVASVIIQTAKVEVAFMQATGSDAPSKFLAQPDDQPALPNGVHATGIVGIRTHRMQG